MIEAIIALIYTAYSLLQAEIEKRQRQAADVTGYIKVLHILDAAGKFLRDGDAAGLEGVVFALNKAVDATDTDAAIVIRKGEVLSEEKQKKFDRLVKGKK
jgi:hypothetical protein